MANLNVEIKGVDRLRRRLLRLSDTEGEVIVPVMRRWKDSALTHLRTKHYPAKRPGQKYIRTGKLAQGFEFKQRGGVVWEITNRAQQKGRLYAHFVVGEKQAWMHKGRWWTARQAIEEKMDELSKFMSKRILGIWHG